MIIRLIAIFLILVSTTGYSFAQSDSNFNMIDSLLILSGIKNPIKVRAFNAEEHIISENYDKAVEILKDLVAEYPDNYNLNFKLGYCYLKTKLEKHKAISFLEKAVQGTSPEYDPDDLLETSAPLESYFYLGSAYHINYQFNEAIDTLYYLRSILDAEETDFILRIDKIIDVCADAKEIEKESLPIILTHLGNGINTEYSEHSPVVPYDESFLVFTSKRKGSTGDILLDDGTYFEDLYISYNQNGRWTKPENMGESINTEYNEAVTSVSFDGRKLFIYKAEGSDGDIYMSESKGNKEWSKPEKLPAPINSRFRETHASLSSDGNELYFTSDRKGGLGGMDIYMVRKLPNGSWGTIINLGPEINTEYDEESPNVSIDGQTLYFSSQGHKSMGGFDIFTSTRSSRGKWSKAENIGYPVSTTEDDVFFMPTYDGRRAYYSTQNTGGMGKSDIFMIRLPRKGEEDKVVCYGTMGLSNDSLISGDITVISQTTGEITGKYTPHYKTGKYLLVLDPGEGYTIMYESKGYARRTENLFIPGRTEEELEPGVIELQHVQLIDQKSQEYQATDTVVINNLSFDFDEAEARGDLDILAEYLKKNPEAIIEIRGHTDANGPEIYNIHLSLKRAIYASNYLIKKGVSPASLIVRGYGEKYPLCIDIPDGSEYESFHKYNRRVEFRVIREGTDKLRINPIQTPDGCADNVIVNIDRDQDGVPDIRDDCPDVEGKADNKGCPNGHSLTMFGIVSDKQTEERLSDVRILITDSISGELMYTNTTDGNGSFSYEVNVAGPTHTLLAKINLKKDGYLSQTINFNYYVNQSGKIILHKAKDLRMSRIHIGTDLAGIIDMQVIYYDFDQTAIREDAAIELDKIVDAMLDNPMIEIELGSHTDSRGDDKYNLELSERRAKEAVNYIVKKGISKKRIKAKGYGEQKLVNKCKNEVDCTDEEHQENRRTEFRITKL